MSEPRQTTRETVAERLPELREPWVAGTVALWFAVSLLAWWRPFSAGWNKIFASEISFALLAAAATAAALARFLGSRGRSARWTYAALASSFLIWFAVELVELASIGYATGPQFDLTSDLLYLTAYSLALVAAETVAARKGTNRGAFHLQIELVATVLVIGALLTYFLLLPFNLDPDRDGGRDRGVRGSPGDRGGA